MMNLEDYSKEINENIDNFGEIYLRANRDTAMWKCKVIINKLESKIIKHNDLAFTSNIPAVGIEINYIGKTQGRNVFIFSQSDVIKIVDIWMGGSGKADKRTRFSEMHESAAGELVAQIARQADIALKKLLNIPIDMDIGNRRVFKIEDDYNNISISGVTAEDTVNLVKLKLNIDDLIASEILVIHQ